MLAKAPLVRLRGQALRELVRAVYVRDNHSCVVCGSWVEDGVKPHHEPCGAGRKSDELNKMVLLCGSCHYERHHGKGAVRVREAVDRYLESVKSDETDY